MSKEAPETTTTEEVAAPKKKVTKAGPKSHKAEADSANATPAPKGKPAKAPRDPHGKKYRAALALVEEGKLYSLDEATELMQKLTTAKFDASVELHVRVGQEARGMIVFPKSTGKKVRVAEATPELLEEVAKGVINFDVLLATPDQMPQLAKHARVLGPKGLMPNPKSGTVTTDIKKAKAELEAGKVEFRTDEGKNIHVVIGKVSTSPADLAENAKTALGAMAAFGLKSISMAPTMGPGVLVALPE